MRHQCTNVTHQVPITMIDAACGEHENALSVCPTFLYDADNGIKMLVLSTSKGRASFKCFFSGYVYLFWNRFVRDTGRRQRLCFVFGHHLNVRCAAFTGFLNFTHFPNLRVCGALNKNEMRQIYETRTRFVLCSEARAFWRLEMTFVAFMKRGLDLLQQQQGNELLFQRHEPNESANLLLARMSGLPDMYSLYEFLRSTLISKM